MAASSLLALIDDIATLLDDIALMTKVAARQGAAAADDVAAMTQLAARKTADGKTLIYVVSDDNFQRPLQRTLIMMFELAE